MKRCPITYEVIPDNQQYSIKGLKKLAPTLKNLKPLDLTVTEQRQKAASLAGKMSVQGIQTKLSAKLNITAEEFEIVDSAGKFILKPQSEYYPQLAENEAITMTLAEKIHLDVPVHGLIYCKDGTMTYFIKRFDRVSHHKKLAVEDFTQIENLNRRTKYNGSMEQIIKGIQRHCSFPKIELVKFFKLTLFNFLVGNEDMHLKNFSLITKNNIVSLAPAYDLLNTSIAQGEVKEELALSLKGRKNNLTKENFLNYFAKKQLELNQQTIDDELNTIHKAIDGWKQLISYSFLTPLMQSAYVELLESRAKRLNLL